MRFFKRKPPPPAPKRSEKVRSVVYDVWGDDEATDRLSRDTSSAKACNPPKTWNRLVLTYEDGRTVTWKWAGRPMTVEYATTTQERP